MAFDVFIKAIRMGRDLLKSVIFNLYENRRQIDANPQQPQISVLQCYESIHVGSFHKFIARLSLDALIGRTGVFEYSICVSNFSRD